MAVLLLAAACSGDDASPSGTPSGTASAVSSPTPTLPPLETLQPQARVSFSDPAVFYGAEAGDSAQAVAAGDFNGDGELDIALGAALADGPDNGEESAGEAYIFFGPFAPGEERDAGAGEQDVTLYGAQAEDETGRAVSAGDVTGDGIDDVIVGAPRAGTPQGNGPGAVYIVPGRSDWPTAIALPGDGPMIAGADAGDLLGFVLDVGDATGDGIADVLAGAFLADGPGEARVDAGEVYLAAGSTSWPAVTNAGEPGSVVRMTGGEPGGQLGESVALADVTGDGAEDLVLSATFAAGAGGLQMVGKVYVVPGGAGLADQDMVSLEPVATGIDDGDQLGHSAASGDLNGDGSVDLLLGAVSADGPGNLRDLAGEVHVLRGPDLPVSTVIYGGDSGTRVGRSLGAGDLDGDGRADLLVPAPGAGATGDDNTGRLFVIFGRDSLPSPLELTEGGYDLAILGRDAGDALGTTILGRPSLIAADFDGDGRDDVVVSAIGDGPANDREDAGETSLYFSRAP
jgi:hypothetical protein